MAQTESHTIEVGGFNDVEPVEGSKRPAFRVNNDGYDASGSNGWEDAESSSYEEVEVEESGSRSGD